MLVRLPEHAVSLCDDVADSGYRGSRTFSTAKLNIGRGNSGKLVTEVKTALFKSVPETELAVIDGSPGVGCPVIASVSGVDLVLIVAEPSHSGIHDMRRILKTAAMMDAKAAVCVNKFDVSVENTEAIERDYSENGIPFMGKIPYDSSVAAINAGGLGDGGLPGKDPPLKGRSEEHGAALAFSRAATAARSNGLSRRSSFAWRLHWLRGKRAALRACARASSIRLASIDLHRRLCAIACARRVGWRSLRIELLRARLWLCFK